MPSGLERRTLVRGIRVRMLPMPLRNLCKFIYPTFPKFEMMFLEYPKRMAVGVDPKESFMMKINLLGYTLYTKYTILVIIQR